LSEKSIEQAITHKIKSFLPYSDMIRIEIINLAITKIAGYKTAFFFYLSPEYTSFTHEEF